MRSKVVAYARDTTGTSLAGSVGLQAEQGRSLHSHDAYITWFLFAMLTVAWLKDSQASPAPEHDQFHPI